MAKQYPLYVGTDGVFAEIDTDFSFEDTGTGFDLNVGDGRVYWLGGIDTDKVSLAVASGALSAQAYVNVGTVSGVASFQVPLVDAGGNAALYADSSGVLTWDTNTVWTQGNHGTGSGLDADLLDGLHAASFQPIDAQLTSLAALTFAGNATKVVRVNAGETDFELATVSGTGTVTSVNLTAPAAGITVAGGPITTAGSITLALANDLAALEAMAGTGIVRRTGAETYSQGTAVAASELAANLIIASIGASFDGAGAALTVGSKCYVTVPYACTITGVRMLADVSGSAVVDIWKDTYANYPATVADTITAAAKPTISAATKSEDTTLTGWTTSVAAGDTLVFNVDSCTTITKLHIQLKGNRT